MKDSKAQETLRENRIIVQNTIIEGKELRYICIALESNKEILVPLKPLTERVTGLTEESMSLYRLLGLRFLFLSRKSEILLLRRETHHVAVID